MLPAGLPQKAHKLIDDFAGTATCSEMIGQAEVILHIKAGLADSAADRVTDNDRVRRE